MAGVLEVAVAAVGELVVALLELVDRVAGVVVEYDLRAGVRPDLNVHDVGRELLPDFGALDELVLVCRRPVEAEHLKDPLKLVRQHDRHSGAPPMSNIPAQPPCTAGKLQSVWKKPKLTQ
ncbi:hypothetical protein QIS99_30575 [Streptomyces sp. B-S-A8]|uniref:Secreted protein n=1 Tax=Streptomyces solicavernae TaxID=3043614 RepID=A0ABT6S1D9_9ACTN|nr:hypothetical protein [Streptomyces sp. B-S-A8]MDI3390507.1 hypothetical protein [Streptomyces sp. B-S-A8]